MGRSLRSFDLVENHEQILSWVNSLTPRKIVFRNLRALFISGMAESGLEPVSIHLGHSGGTWSEAQCRRSVNTRTQSDNAETPGIRFIRDKKSSGTWGRVLYFGAKKCLNLCSLEDQLRSGTEKEAILHFDRSWDSDTNTWQKKKKYVGVNGVASIENETEKFITCSIPSRKESGLENTRHQVKMLHWVFISTWEN